MSNVTDLQALKRKKIRKKAYHALLIITAALLLVYGVSKLTNNPNFVGFSSILELFRTGEGYPLNAPGGKSKGMYENSGNLIVVNETNLYMYNANGSTTFDVPHQMINPKVVMKGSMVLNYDRGSKSYSAYNRSTPFVSTKSDDPIRCGDISADGQIVLATQKGTSQSVVTVYDKSHQWKIKREINESTVTAVAISDNGNRVAIATSYVENGILKSKLTLMQGDKTTGERVLDGQLILTMQYRGDHVQVITDQEAFLCDSAAKLLGQYQFSQTLASYDIHNNGVVLVLGDYEQERRYTIVSLSADSQTVLGKNLIEESLQQKVKVLENTIVVLGSKDLVQYSVIDCSVLQKDAADSYYDMQPMGKWVYAMTSTQIVRVPLVEPSKFSILNKIAQGELEIQQNQEQMELPKVVAVPGLSKSDKDKETEKEKEQDEEDTSSSIPSLSRPGETVIGMSGNENLPEGTTIQDGEDMGSEENDETPEIEEEEPTQVPEESGGRRLPQKAPVEEKTEEPEDTEDTKENEDSTQKEEKTTGGRIPQTIKKKTDSTEEDSTKDTQKEESNTEDESLQKEGQEQEETGSKRRLPQKVTE